MEKQISFLFQVPFPSDPHLQWWITSTFYVLASEGESLPLCPAEEATINSYEPALVPSLTLPSWVWLTHCYTLLILHTAYMIVPSRALQDPPRDKLPMQLWHFVPPLTSAMLSASHLLQCLLHLVALSSGSSSAHHAAVQQKQRSYSISLNSHGCLNDGERIRSCQWQSGFKVSRWVRIQMGNKVVQWLPLGGLGPFRVVSSCLCGTLTSSHSQ